MTIKVNDVLSEVVTYLNELIATEIVMFSKTNVMDNIVALNDFLLDVRFQIDFTLMSSPVEVQELYDKYRIREVSESNLVIRSLMDLAGHIRIYIDDNNTTPNGYITFIDRLAGLLTMHSTVDLDLTCQDESFTLTMDKHSWVRLMESNPWLVATVCIRMIPSYYIVDMTITKLIETMGVSK